MKRNSAKYLLFIGLLTAFLHSHAQTTWTMMDPKNLDFTIHTSTNGNRIIGSTRKNALKDYVGTLKYKLIKMASSLKYPEIVHFEGTFETESKTVFSGTYHHLFSQHICHGKITGDSISITLLNKQGKVIKEIKGCQKKTTESKLYENTALKIIQLTEQHLFNPEFLKSSAWKNFKLKLMANSKKIEDKLELQTGFYAIAKDFPFTHYNLMANVPIQESKNNFSLKNVNSSTCILKIKSFEGPRTLMDSLISKIEKQHYTNLIIDLRGNTGGTNETALPLMSYLVAETIIGGIFPNKNWYSLNKMPPTNSDYNIFNEFNFGTLEEFYDMANTGNGLYINVLPGKHHFKGKVYILCNQNTASTSEILIQGLRESNIGQLIGKKTAGAALSGRRFYVDNDLSLFIPVNDYISRKGYKIDKNGIKPDIDVDSDALTYVLQKITNDQAMQAISPNH